MSYNSFKSPLLIGLIILLHFCGYALSDKEFLLSRPENGWFTVSKKIGSQSTGGGWFAYEKNLFSVCDSSTNVGEPKNWLRTDFIDLKDAILIDIVVNYTMRKCRSGQKYCQEYFKLYGYQTSNTAPKPNPLETPFDFLAQALPTNVPDRQTGAKDYNMLKVSLKTKSKGLYLALYDEGACLSLLGLLVSFNYCPEKGTNLVTFVKTASPLSNSKVNQVEGKCTDKHSRNTSVLMAACMSDGNWKMNDSVGCLCQPVYEYSENPEPHCKRCVSGKYKNEMSNTQCQSCPKNSAPDTNHKSCVCQDGFYKLKNSPISFPCEALPNGPSFVNATTLNSTAVLITWAAIKNINTSFTHSIDCFWCKYEWGNNCAEECGDNIVYYPAKDGFKTTWATVSGLPSEGNFLFKVYVVMKINSAVSRSLWKYTGVYGKTKKASFPRPPAATTGDAINGILAGVVVVVAVLAIAGLVIALLLVCRRKSSKKEKGTGRRKLSSVQDKNLEAYEIAHPMEDSSHVITAPTAPMLKTEEDLYETIDENIDEGTAAIAANVKPARGPSDGAQGEVPLLPQHYQELQRKAPNATTLYEPLDHKHRDFGNKGILASEGPKAYQELQKSVLDKEYQPLKRYKDTESKVRCNNSAV